VRGSARRDKGQKQSQASVTEVVHEDGIRRHHEITRAHTDAVTCIVIADDAIYTASRDKLLKRWKATRNAMGLFELIPDVEVALGDPCFSMCFAGEWLFCGLGNGDIRAYAKTGKQAALFGHSKRVSSLLIHLHVLLSGSRDGSIRCWQMNPASETFDCTHTITEGIPGSVECMLVLGEHLWVGGTSGVAIIELASLRVINQLQPKKFVASLIPFEGHCIAAYQDGSMLIFAPNGAQKHAQPPLPAGPVHCLCGLDSGPRLLCGHAKGQVSSVVLPMFHLKRDWQALPKCKVQSLCSAGHDGIFIVGAENGNLQLWQRQEPDEI